MSNYFIIESRDPFGDAAPRRLYALAEELLQQGHSVTLFLVENGALAARRTVASEQLSRISRKGVRVVADRFSMRERGIAGDRMAPDIEVGEIDLVAEALESGAQTMWH